MQFSDSIIGSNELALVTGSTGFLGTKVVEAFLDAGFKRLRCFVRPASNLGHLASVLSRFPDRHVELCRGNLTNSTDCHHATEEVSLLIHCAAGMGGGLVNMYVDSVVSSRNLLDALVEQHAVKRIVHVSSFAVYQAATLKRGALLTEKTLLESHHDLRDDSYAYTKHKQELLFWKYHREAQLPLVVVRPGVIFGPGGPEISGRVGINLFGLFLHTGGNNLIPLTYVDNCAEAIVQAMTKPGIEGQVFNIHDDDLPTARSFLREYKRTRGGLHVIRMPYLAMQGLSRLVKWYAGYSQDQLPAAFTPYKTASIWKEVRFDNSKAKKVLGWMPRVPMTEALAAHFDFIRAKEGA